MYQVTASLPCGSSLKASIQSSRRTYWNSPGRKYHASQRVKSGRAGGVTVISDDGAIADKFDNTDVIFVMEWTSIVQMSNLHVRWGQETSFSRDSFAYSQKRTSVVTNRCAGNVGRSDCMKHRSSNAVHVPSR